MNKNKFYVVLFGLFFNFVISQSCKAAASGGAAAFEQQEGGVAAPNHYSGAKGLRTIEEIHAIPKEIRDRITKQAVEHMTPDMTPTQKNNLIHIFLSFPNGEDRVKLVKDALDYIGKDMRGSDRVLVFDGLSKMKDEERDGVLKVLRSRFTTDPAHKARLIRILSRVSEGKRIITAKRLKFSPFGFARPEVRLFGIADPAVTEAVIRALSKVENIDLSRHIKRVAMQTCVDLFHATVHSLGYPRREGPYAGTTRRHRHNIIKYLETPLDTPLPGPKGKETKEALEWCKSIQTGVRVRPSFGPI